MAYQVKSQSVVYIHTFNLFLKNYENLGRIFVDKGNKISYNNITVSLRAADDTQKTPSV